MKYIQIEDYETKLAQDFGIQSGLMCLIVDLFSHDGTLV